MADDREEVVRAFRALESAMERARKFATHRTDAKARTTLREAREVHETIMQGLASRDPHLRSAALLAGQQLDAWESIAQNADPRLQG